MTRRHESTRETVAAPAAPAAEVCNVTDSSMFDIGCENMSDPGRGDSEQMFAAIADQVQKLNKEDSWYTYRRQGLLEGGEDFMIEALAKGEEMDEDAHMEKDRLRLMLTMILRSGLTSGGGGYAALDSTLHGHYVLPNDGPVDVDVYVGKIWDKAHELGRAMKEAEIALTHVPDPRPMLNDIAQEQAVAKELIVAERDAAIERLSRLLGEFSDEEEPTAPGMYQQLDHIESVYEDAVSGLP